ncbi:MAG TPA: ABC transporter permease [Candidatus Avoscillospira avistercoris]|uniref:ABC transporter permease n=1 Tax=Candidatus Avoscillospira avistercoris TaxID=2840707 RepID=A0A9D1FAL3_9FIRM|nr:ABC transporter permease [Candidatus Avoscillospira avistercoris]
MESFKMAVGNIRTSKMRSFLTMLGIIIGVAAVIVIVGMGNGMEIYMTEQFESMGTNTLTVSIYGRGTGRTVTDEDMYDIVERNSDALELLSPTVTMQSPAKIGTDTINSTSITGVSEDYFTIKDYDVAMGRGLQYVDMLKRSRVCVVGTYLNQEYFGGNALGQTVKIGGTPFTVVGVLNEIGDSTEYSSDNAIFVPYTTAARLSNMGTISSYTVTVTDVNNSTWSKGVLEKELFDIFEDDNAYTVISMAEILDLMTQMLDVMITVLAAIAAISLVVGGIGIMNIMLVSVSERTREIGVRKALGAKERYIMSQFVIEAATTSAIGGAVGIAFGQALSSLATAIIVAALDTDLAVTPSVGSIALAVGISVAIGILFGYLPAKKAARLNPIDALRHD